MGAGSGFNSGSVGALDTNPLKYKAYISQSGTDAPRLVAADGSDTASPIMNTFPSAGVWSYVAEGVYRFTITGAFPDKAKVLIRSAMNSGILGANGYVEAYYADENYISIESVNNGLYVDGFANTQLIEIEVYP